MKNFKNSLSRTEMKTIYAGHGGGTGPVPISDNPCSTATCNQNTNNCCRGWICDEGASKCKPG